MNNQLNLIILFTVLMLSSCAYDSIEDLKDIDFSYEAYTGVAHGFLPLDFEKIPFQPVDHLDLGFYEGEIWVKVQLLNHSSEQQALVIRNHDKVNRTYQFYKLDVSQNKLVAQRKPKDSLLADHRTFNFPKPNFKISLRAKEQATFYIHSSGDGKVVHATPRLSSLDRFIEIMNRDTIENIFFYGAMFIILMINFFYWKILKRKIYVYYTLYIFLMSLVYLGFDGYLHCFKVNVFVIDHLLMLFFRFSILSLLFFSAQFLNTNKSSPRFYAFLKIYPTVIIIGISLIQIVFFTKSSGNLHKLETVFGFNWLLLLVIMVTISIKEKQPETKFYLYALLASVVFTVIAIINTYIPTGITGNLLFKTGTTIEIIIFTYTTAIILGTSDQKIKALKTDLIEKENEKEHYIESTTLLENQNQQLQSKVEHIGSTKIPKTDFLAIFKLLESNLSGKEDWTNFKHKFEGLNPTFLDNLYQQHPELTKAEIRLLTLVKIGFTQKEISGILYIADSSVKKAKQRVRKKIALTPDVTLSEYLKAF